MKLLDDLLVGLPDGKLLDVRIGLHWTAVVLEVEGDRRCGLSATLSGKHAHGREPDVPKAGQIEMYSGRELATMLSSHLPTMASLGTAALNALLPRFTKAWVDANAEEMLIDKGTNKHVVMVGSFPFVKRVRPLVKELLVLEQTPGPGEFPAEAAKDVLPQAEVIAITGMTLVNHTLEDLLGLCPPEAFIMILGPSTPLSPIFFERGVDMLSGAVVTAIDPVLRLVSQGGNFHQVRRAGVRLVNISRDTWNTL